MLMPGGLTRVTGSAETMVVSLQSGGGSKDTWVLTEGAVSNFTLLPGANESIALTRAGNDLPSRAADNLFWLGRYVQRAEDMVRLLRGILVRMTEKSGLAEVPLPTLSASPLDADRPGFIAKARSDSRPERVDRRLRAKVVYRITIAIIARLVGARRISMDMWHPVEPAAEMARSQRSADALPALICSISLDPR